MNARNRRRLFWSVIGIAFVIQATVVLLKWEREAQWCYISVVDTKGEPIPGADLLGGSGGHGRDRNFLRIRAEVGTRETKVFARGYRTTTVPVMPGTHRLALRRGIPVTLVLPEEFELPAPPHKIVVWVDSTDPLEETPYNGISLAEGGEAALMLNPILAFERHELHLLIHAPGTYRLRWQRATVEITPTSTSVGGTQIEEAGSINVADLDTPQRFELRLER